jgi:hypothetical protein
MPQKTLPIELVDGVINELPQLYNPSIRTGGTLRVLLATEPHQGTVPHGPRSPDATILAFQLAPKDAIELAVEISKWAEIRGERLPKGVLYRGELH